MHKNWMVLMATAAVIGTLQVGGALAQEEPQTGGALRILATGEPDHMDPTLAGMVPTARKRASAAAFMDSPLRFALASAS